MDDICKFLFVLQETFCGCPLDKLSGARSRPACDHAICLAPRAYAYALRPRSISAQGDGGRAGRDCNQD
jgi:hypothetical protein